MGQSADGRRYVTTDLESVDDQDCSILHVDMDAFFASVELRRRPELRGRPMMVAGEQRGVVLSATYEARRHGVRSAMPTARARAMCPGIVVLPPDHTAYRQASRQVMAVFADVTPLVEPLSVDEAFLDISGARRIAGRPGAIAKGIRRRLAGELGLTATVGGAATKFVAKLASGLAKPDGLLLVPPADVHRLLDPLPVRALWGVGPKTAVLLENLGLRTVGEVARTQRSALIRALGQATGSKLHELANGVDDRQVRLDTAEVSIGAENTFATDVADRGQIDRELLALSDRTARRARTAGVRGRTVSIKVRFADFSTVNRSATLDPATDLSDTIYRTARELLDRLSLIGRRVRLIGVRLEGLTRAEAVTEQLTLDAEPERPGWREAEVMLDEVGRRFGPAAIGRATLLPKPPG